MAKPFEQKAAPFLKNRSIGIAMGKKVTEIANQASSLILVDDDLARMADAVAMGRKIHQSEKWHSLHHFHPYPHHYHGFHFLFQALPGFSVLKP